MWATVIFAQEIEYNKGKWSHSKGDMGQKADSVINYHKDKKKFDNSKKLLVNQIDKMVSSIDEETSTLNTNAIDKKELVKILQDTKDNIYRTNRMEDLELDRISGMVKKLESSGIDTKRFNKIFSKLNSDLKKDEQKFHSIKENIWRKKQINKNFDKDLLEKSINEKIKESEPEKLKKTKDNIDNLAKVEDIKSQLGYFNTEEYLSKYDPSQQNQLLKFDSLPRLNRDIIVKESLAELDSINLKNQKLMKFKGKYKDIDPKVSKLTFNKTDGLKNLFFEGTLGLSGKDYREFSVSPIIGYNINKSLSVGAGVTYHHKLDDDNNIQSTLGYNLLARMDILQHRAYLQAENEFMLPNLSYFHKESELNTNRSKSLFMLGFGAIIINLNKNAIVAQISYAPFDRESSGGINNLLFKIGIKRK